MGRNNILQTFNPNLQRISHFKYSKKFIIVNYTKRGFTNHLNFLSLKKNVGASLVAQWLRICLPMQETRVRALVWEDPTCHGATGPVSHNY